MKRRTRRSKLRGVRRRRRTLRRGGRTCANHEIPGFQLRMHQHLQIIEDMIKIYESDPSHVFTVEVKDLVEKHCEKFLEELVVVINSLHTDKYGRVDKNLYQFHQALLRRYPALIEQNLSMA